MKAKPVSLVIATAILGLSLTITSCSKTETNGMTPQTASKSNTLKAGITTTIPAYYDSKLYNIQFTPLPANAAATQIAKNPGINFIYQSDPGLPGNQPFISVIDAIPTDGMNPIWREVQIAFNPGFTPVQFFRDDDVIAAAAGTNPMITLTYTDEVYTCPVMGIK